MIKSAPGGGNKLLATLSSAQLKELQSMTEFIPTQLRQPLGIPSQKIENVFFPCSGMISLVRHLKDGSAVEVGLIGNEGFVGVALLFGAVTEPLEPMVQGSGVVMRIGAADFQKFINRHHRFHALLLRYAQALNVQVIQTAVCNARHKVPQRLTRWLLEAQDRMGRSELPLSHEFLSYMLGSRRASISDELKHLKSKGFIESGRSSIKICDRAALESFVCECYRATQRETKLVMNAA